MQHRTLAAEHRTRNNEDPTAFRAYRIVRSKGTIEFWMLPFSGGQTLTGSAEGERPLYDEERETKFRELRATLFQSIANGGEASETDINAALDAKARQLQKEGF